MAMDEGCGDIIRPVPEQPSQQSSLTPERRAGLLAYCKLTELADDPEVGTLIPTLYDAAVGYMENAGVSQPEAGTSRAAQYDLCVNYLVLDSFERRETAMVATVVADNPAFRRLVNQLKLTEPSGTSFGFAERPSQQPSDAQGVNL